MNGRVKVLKFPLGKSCVWMRQKLKAQTCILRVKIYGIVFKIYLFLKWSLCVCSVWRCVLLYVCRLSGPKAKGSCELPSVSAGDQTWILCKSNVSSWLLSHCSSPICKSHSATGNYVTVIINFICMLFIFTLNTY